MGDTFFLIAVGYGKWPTQILYVFLRARILPTLFNG